MALIASSLAGIAPRIRSVLWPVLFTVGLVSLLLMLHYSSHFSGFYDFAQYDPFQKKADTHVRFNLRAKPSKSSRNLTWRPKPPQSREATKKKSLTQAEIASRFEERRKILESACKLHATSKDFRLLGRTFTYYGPYAPVMNKTVGYCGIQKTSSTTWKGVFKNIKDYMKQAKVPQGSPKLPPDIAFAFIREPYGRLLSAYVDKIFSPNTMFWSKIGKYAIANFRKNASKTSLRCGHDVTFPEYVKYIIHAQTTGQHRDGHFIPTHDHCQFCQNNWTHIGHLETVNEDMPYLIKLMQSPYVYNVASFDNSTTKNNANMVLSTMRKKVSECISLDEATRRLWKKWHVRGVLNKPENFPLTREQTRDITTEEFTKVAWSALARSGERSERVGQKKEALREAFSSVPLEDRLKLKRVLMLDFEMFGFDPEPDEVFPQKPFVNDPPDFRYFDLYK